MKWFIVCIITLSVISEIADKNLRNILYAACAYSSAICEILITNHLLCVLHIGRQISNKVQFLKKFCENRFRSVQTALYSNFQVKVLSISTLGTNGFIICEANFG